MSCLLLSEISTGGVYAWDGQAMMHVGPRDPLNLLPLILLNPAQDHSPLIVDLKDELSTPTYIRCFDASP